MYTGTTEDGALSPRSYGAFSQVLVTGAEMTLMTELLETEHRPTEPRGHSTSKRRRRTMDRTIEGVVLQIKGLVFVRALLEQRGATELELAEHSAELNRQRDRLAELVRETA